MDSLYIVQGFKSKYWPLPAYDKDIICMLAKKNELESHIYNATIHEYGTSYDEYYVQVIFFKKGFYNKGFYNVFADDMYLVVKKDLSSYDVYDAEEFGYAKTLKDYLMLCCNGAFGHKSQRDYSIFLYKTCEISLEELLIYRDIRKDIA